MQQEKKTEEVRPSHPVSSAPLPLPDKEEFSAPIRQSVSPGLSPAPLPGDVRRGLRSPDLPNTLPMTIDGKINREDQTNA